LNDRTSDIAKNDATLMKQTLLPELQKENRYLEYKTGNLETKTNDLETKATNWRTNFFNKLDAAKTRFSVRVMTASWIGRQVRDEHSDSDQTDFHR